MNGSVFNLNVQVSSRVFYSGYNSPTYGYNGSFLGPTLLINKGDSITLNVSNNLPVATTVHWHGFHVAPQNDGGPHQVISPGTTWSPSFVLRNNAATFWYHPHGEGKTEIQISKGLAGMIIVRDSLENSYSLPRSYGLDDFPLIVQTKAFDVLYQFATATHEDSVVMVNGTLEPYLQVPKQIVRFRILNASADRTFNFGFSDNSSFYQVASDGGLLSQPALMNRLRLSTGERAEILFDFSSYTIGQQLYLLSYASELPYGIIGADSVGTANIIIGEGYYSNPLNGADFNILRLDITGSTPDPVVSVPAAFNALALFDTTNVAAERNIHFSPDTSMFGSQAYVDGPFLMNGKSFNMDSVNIITYLNSKEIWTLTNSTMVAHPFHIHDIQFNILDINGGPPSAQYSGWKDVMLVQPKDTIRFITRFETFADNSVPYMFHCHLLHHEDEGMMGSFLVIDTVLTNSRETANNEVVVFPNPATEKFYVLKKTAEVPETVSLLDLIGRETPFARRDISPNLIELDLNKVPVGIYFIRLKYSDHVLVYKMVKG